MLRFYKATYLSLLFKFILSERSSTNLYGSDVLLFSECIDVVYICIISIWNLLYCYTFLVISFVQYKKSMISRISFHLLVPVLLVIFEAFV